MMALRGPSRVASPPLPSFFRRVRRAPVWGSAEEASCGHERVLPVMASAVATDGVRALLLAAVAGDPLVSLVVALDLGYSSTFTS